MNIFFFLCATEDVFKMFHSLEHLFSGRLTAVLSILQIHYSNAEGSLDEAFYVKVF